MPLPYALARDVDDFLGGMAVEGTEFWVRFTGSPTIDERHRICVPCVLAFEEPTGLLRQVHSGTLKAFPSTLYDLDQRWRDDTIDADTYYLIHVEREGRGRKYKVYDHRKRTLPVAPAADAPAQPPVAPPLVVPAGCAHLRVTVTNGIAKCDGCGLTPMTWNAAEGRWV